MPIRVSASKGYLVRLALIAAFCIGFGGYFLFDGLYTYPRQLARGDLYRRLLDDGRLEEWSKEADAAGLGVEPADETDRKRTPWDIQFQLIIAAALALPSAYFLGLLIIYLRRWVKLTDTGLATSGGVHVPYGDIERIEKFKWEKKGIAHAVYKDGARERRILLDDWKFQTEPMRQLMKELEAAVGTGKIVGGPSEVEIEARKKAQAEADPSPKDV